MNTQSYIFLNPKNKTKLPVKTKTISQENQQIYQARMMQIESNTCVPEVADNQNSNSQTNSSQPIRNQVPYSHLIYGKNTYSNKTISAHLLHTHKSIKTLNRLTDLARQKIASEVRRKKVSISRRTKSTKKTLCLDLDQTLIHAGFQNSEFFTESLEHRGVKIYFTVRPYAVEFLVNLSQYYEILIYTASDPVYASLFFNYFNQRSGNAISGFLSRQHCIEIIPQFVVKDVSVISNRYLKDIILVDNHAYCFGLNIDNGVPILAYRGDSFDDELQQLQKHLQQMAMSEDVREYIREWLRLEEITSVELGRKCNSQEDVQRQNLLQQEVTEVQV